MGLVVFPVIELPVLLPSVNALARQGKNYRFANFSGINVRDADRGFFG